MAPGSPYPPVFTLPQDVLEEILIFRVNNKPPVLRDVKSISQVCHDWREIVMGFPSLWGRVISLGELNQPRDDWRIEVLRRTKTSALHIFGPVLHQRTLDFVLSLMEAQWSRIRRLDIRILASLHADLDHRWRAVLQPAPLLQSFALDIEKRPYAALTSPGKPLFGDHAPQLHNFVPSAIDYDLRGSWTSTLRRLELTLKHPLTIPQLLEALKCMEQLEHLQINTDFYDDVEQAMRSPHVRLPHLKYIQMKNARWAAISLLDHIHPAPGCALDFSACELKLQVKLTSEYQRIIARYTENYYGLGIATNLHIHIDSSEVSIKDPDPEHPPMYIKWAFPGSESSKESELLSLLCKDTFSNVTHLLLFAEYYWGDHIITKFLSYFPSLETLHILPSVIQDIPNSYRYCTNRNPFPHLHTLEVLSEMHYVEEELYLDREQEDGILDFLLWRNEIGAPIAVLEVDREWGLSDLNFLKKIEGLNVFWTSPYHFGRGLRACKRDLVW